MALEVEIQEEVDKEVVFQKEVDIEGEEIIMVCQENWKKKEIQYFQKQI